MKSLIVKFPFAQKMQCNSLFCIINKVGEKLRVNKDYTNNDHSSNYLSFEEGDELEILSEYAIHHL